MSNTKYGFTFIPTQNSEQEETLKRPLMKVSPYKLTAESPVIVPLTTGSLNKYLTENGKPNTSKKVLSDNGKPIFEGRLLLNVTTGDIISDANPKYYCPNCKKLGRFSPIAWNHKGACPSQSYIKDPSKKCNARYPNGPKGEFYTPGEKEGEEVKHNRLYVSDKSSLTKYEKIEITSILMNILADYGKSNPKEVENFWKEVIFKDYFSEEDTLRVNNALSELRKSLVDGTFIKYIRSTNPAQGKTEENQDQAD
jgi:hypothetical protein